MFELNTVILKEAYLFFPLQKMLLLFSLICWYELFCYLWRLGLSKLSLAVNMVRHYSFYHQIHTCPCVHCLCYSREVVTDEGIDSYYTSTDPLSNNGMEWS